MSDLKDFNITKNGVLRRYKGNETSVVIPNCVTSIGKRALENCKSITNIVIPNGVTKIGDNAFSSCESLVSIEIPDSVTEISYGAFIGCSALMNIDFPCSLKSFYGYDLSDGKRVFWEDGLLIIDGVLVECNIRSGILRLPDKVKRFSKHLSLSSDIEQIFVKDINSVPGQYRLLAVNNLPAYISELSENQIRKYISLIKRNTARLKKQALENLQLLRLILEYDCLIPEMLDEYITEATKTNNVEAATLLLSSKRKSDFDNAFDLEDDIEADPVKGKVFVVTESFNSSARSLLKSIISHSGGRLVGRISSKTDYLICNNVTANTDKVISAKSLGIKIISEKDLYDMISSED